MPCSRNMSPALSEPAASTCIKLSARVHRSTDSISRTYLKGNTLAVTYHVPAHAHLACLTDSFSRLNIMSKSLYGTRNPAKSEAKPISSSLSFASNLSSLIASSKSKPNTASKAQPTSKSKSDIFTTHNRNISKRKHADLSQDHQTKHDVGTTSTSDLHRSKRKMEEKSRLYAAMKRGEYVPHSNSSHHDTSLVDFDRKWAESQTKHDHDARDSADSDSNTSSENDQEQVTWTDEFGRLRKGTAKGAPAPPTLPTGTATRSTSIRRIFRTPRSS